MIGKQYFHKSSVLNQYKANITIVNLNAVVINTLMCVKEPCQYIIFFLLVNQYKIEIGKHKQQHIVQRRTILERIKCHSKS